MTAGRGGAGLRGHPGDPPRRRVARSPSSPGTRIPEKAGLGARLGRRSPRFPGTLVFYMGVRSLPRHRRAADRRTGARRTSRPRWSSAGTLPGPAHRDRARSPTIAARGGRGGDPRRPPITVVGPVGRAARARWPGCERGRCTGARVAVTRARAQASGLAARLRGARRRGGGDPGDPDRAAAAGRRAAGGGVAHPRVRPRVPHEPERRAAALRRAGRGPGATRARSPAPPWPRSARARRRSCALTGSRPTWCRERSIAEALVEALGGRARGRAARCWSPARAEARDVLPDAPARARRRGRRAGALRDRRRAARRGRRARLRSRADYVTFTSSSTVRFFLEAGGARGPDGARVLSRSGR